MFTEFEEKTSMIETALNNMENHNSPLEAALRELPVNALTVFQEERQIRPLRFSPLGGPLQADDGDRVARTFPKLLEAGENRLLSADGPLSVSPGKRIAVLFSGGPASGGHNVVAGIKRVLGVQHHLIGVQAGPKGLVAGDVFDIAQEDVDRIQNLGGFDFLGSDRKKIKSENDFAAVRKTVADHKLDGLIVVGGDDSNTNAAFLAEDLADLGCTVVGVPKTIDGDLQLGKNLPITFGFDTATKIYAEMVGNLLQDTHSSLKYWHFVKLMGRSASHVTLEVALQTRSPIVLISEQIKAENWSLARIVDMLYEKIKHRAEAGLPFGVVLIPEGLIEFIPEFTTLIAQLNTVLADGDQDRESVLEQLDPSSRSLFVSLPPFIQTQLLMERDAHGNLQVSLVPTERLLIEMVAQRLVDSPVSGFKFVANAHFFGYEGRCGAPTRFDADFTFNLGLVAGSLVLGGHSGYMAAVTDLDKGGRALGIPLTGLITAEMRDGKESMVIEKALVDLDSPAFRYYKAQAKRWLGEAAYTSPGPRQFWGPASSQMPLTVSLNQGYDAIGYNLGTEV